MNYRSYVLSFLLVASLLDANAGAETAPAVDRPEQSASAREKLQALEQRFGKKPNILVFLVDDMGWGDPGCFGGGEAVGAPTPNIDRLAQGGLRLTSTYAQPLCSPTRATMMTGRLPIRHGIMRPPMYSEPGGLVGEVTAANLLSDAGYTTAIVGKWHLGERPEQQPQNVGYDEFFGFLGVANIYTEWRDEYFNPEIATKPEKFRRFEELGFNHNLVQAKRGGALKDVKEIDIPVLANIDQDFADYTVDFLNRQKGSAKPFYLIHSFCKVHFDNYPADGYKGKSPAGFPYKDAVVEVDDIVGRVMDALRATGELENTFVFFTSDNGVEEDTWPDAGYAPWRGSKGTTWEGGMRVPGIAYWPGTIAAGRASDGLVDLADLFNTAVSLGGASATLPSDRYIDGIDQTSFFLADNGESNREVVYYWQGPELAAVRWSEYKWHRFITNIDDGRYDALGGMNRGTFEKADKAIVYNLYTDPRERVPQVIRKTWLVQFFQPIIMKHLATLRKYPPKAPQVTIN